MGPAVACMNVHGDVVVGDLVLVSNGFALIKTATDYALVNEAYLVLSVINPTRATTVFKLFQPYLTPGGGGRVASYTELDIIRKCIQRLTQDQHLAAKIIATVVGKRPDRFPSAKRFELTTLTSDFVLTDTSSKHNNGTNKKMFILAQTAPLETPKRLDYWFKAISEYQHEHPGRNSDDHDAFVIGMLDTHVLLHGKERCIDLFYKTFNRKMYAIDNQNNEIFLIHAM